MNYQVAKNSRGHLLFSEEQEEFIVKEYHDSSYGSTQLSSKFNVSRGAILRVLRRNDVSIKKPAEYRKYDLDEDFFNKIDTEEKAYWLGFLYADGYVDEKGNTLRVNLAVVDWDHLEKLNHALKTTRPIKNTLKRTSEKEYQGCYLAVTSKKLIEDLVSLGCYQGKSLTLKFPDKNIVPENLTHHFIRGYFDGDGCITSTTSNRKYSSRKLYKIKIVGTESFLEEIKKYFQSSVKLYQKKGMEDGCFYADFGGNLQVVQLYEYMYKEATIFLDRKYEKFQEMIRYLEENPNVHYTKIKRQNGE